MSVSSRQQNDRQTESCERELWRVEEEATRTTEPRLAGGTQRQREGKGGARERERQTLLAGGSLLLLLLSAGRSRLLFWGMAVGLLLPLFLC